MRHCLVVLASLGGEFRHADQLTAHAWIIRTDGLEVGEALRGG
jgi:hypothetical protein